MSMPFLTTPPLARFNGNADAALYWFKFGLTVIPILPHSKQAVMKWDPWLATLSLETIQNHWSQNPSHELACIVGDNLIVLDTDSPAADKALGLIEAAHGCPPLFIVKTNKGFHHYFRIAPGAYAKSDSHHTDTYPDRIDVKTGRGMIVLPPSTDKTISSCHVDSVDGSMRSIRISSMPCLSTMADWFRDRLSLQSGRRLHPLSLNPTWLNLRHCLLTSVQMVAMRIGYTY